MMYYSGVPLFLVFVQTVYSFNDVGKHDEILNRLALLEDRVHQQGLLEKKIQDLEEQNTRQEEIINKLIQKDRKVEQKVNRRYAEVPIGFTAVIDNPANFVDHIRLNTVLKFNKVLTNIGNGYNEHTGIFTAPYDSVYVFHFVTSVAYGAEALWTRLLVDGVAQTGAVAKSIQDSQDIQGGNHAVLQLRKGQAVWVETFQSDDVHIFAREGFSSFTGYLLY